MSSLRGQWSRLRGSVTGAGAAAGLALLLLATGIAAGSGAASTAGQSFPGLLLDPSAVFSSVSLPSWELEKDDLGWPDRLVAINGQPLSRDDRYPGLAATERIRGLAARGDQTVTLTFRKQDGRLEDHVRPIRRIGATEIGFFFAFYAVVALFCLWTGGMVLVLSGQRAGARAYALWSVGGYLSFIAFYDYHTTGDLTFAFFLGGVAFPLGFLWLAYAFPSPPRVLGRTLRVAIWAATAAGIAAAIWMQLAPRLGRDASTTRWVVAISLQVAMVVLALSIVLRLQKARGTERADLLAAMWGLIATPAALTGGYALLTVTGSPIIHLALPFVAPFVPLSIGVALVRHNILNTSALLSRRLMVGPVALAAIGVGILVWLGLRQLLREDISPWWGVALSVPAAVGAFVTLSRLSTWMLFQATSQFRPTLEQLSDQLSRFQELAAIQRAIESIVSRWLPISAPVRVLQAQELRSLSGLPPKADQRLTAGEHLWLVQGQRTSPLLFPMKSLSTLRGAILLPPKRQGALYTTEDFTLLSTIASLGAVALHHSSTLVELEAIRRKVVEAARDDKRFALSVVGAELSHEIAYSLNFLRFLLKRCARGDALEPQDLEIGSEEVARLERMLDAMKKLGSSSTDLKVVRVLVPVRHVVELIREHVEEKRLQVHVEVPEHLCVLADADMVLQIFANLLRNSAQAVGMGGSIGVRVTQGTDGVQVECWDDGPGVPLWLREKIWTPWASTTKGGTGLGLVITQRLVQKLGWRITLETRGERTSFCIHIPASALREQPPPARAA